jgi:hypothetical protein
VVALQFCPDEVEEGFGLGREGGVDAETSGWEMCNLRGWERVRGGLRKRYRGF